MPRRKSDIDKFLEAEAGMNRVRRLIVLMTFFVTVPATVTAVLVGYLGVRLPDWLMAALLVEVLCVEGMIFFFTAKLTIMSEVASSLYEDIIKSLKTIRRPLEGIGRILYNMKDVLPEIEMFLKKVDKEQVREFIRTSSRQMEINRSKLSQDEIKNVALRLTGRTDDGHKVGGPSK
ncbi:MAG: hypothetical protein A2W25_04200 [candidate division Zixibacteria bacterium RBG_16_53_22]|nr:MAG: hypothetical protein A2W25_04200 [candidate division Zixibacteria bacterium RBG_16_53_22]